MALNVTVAPLAEVASTEKSDGTVNVGAVVSPTVTWKLFGAEVFGVGLV